MLDCFFWREKSQFFSRKVVLREVWGDQFLYLYLRYDYKLIFWLLQCFSFDLSPPFIHGRSLTLYSSLWVISILHLSIIWTTTWVLVPSDILSSLLRVVVVKAALFRSFLHINAARKLVARHSMRCQQLFLRYS